MNTNNAKTKQYLSRIRETSDGVTVFCNNCEQWKSGSGFHTKKGKYHSICKACHSKKYGKGSGYKSPRTIQAQKEAKERKEAWLNELQTCTSCGVTKPRKDFYNKDRKAYLPYCCSNRRTEAQIDEDIKEQMKDCNKCGLRLPFSEFGDNQEARDGKRWYCKCCDTARLKIYSENKDREDQIRATDDGTISIEILSKMLRDTTHCQHCGVKMTQDYPVTPYNKTIDHDVPLSRNGRHTISNITVMCFGCNSAKQARTLEEFSKVKKKMATE